MINKFKTRLLHFFKTKKFWLSFLSALFLTVANYFANNQPVFTGESLSQYYWTHQICKWLGINKEVDYGEVEFFNVSYDKVVIPAIDEYEDTLGVNVVTDRKKLYDFLVLLDSSKNYRFVIIDLAFNKNDVTSYDDSLFSQILKMKNIVFANDGHDVSEQLYNKGKDALVDFFTTTAEKNITKFRLIDYNTGEKTIPLYVYGILNNKTINRHGFFPFYWYSDSGKLCQNSIFPTFDDLFNDERDRDTIKHQYDEYGYSSALYTNIGEFLKRVTNREEIINELSSLTEQKIVVIGDFSKETFDRHDTYIGHSKPGALILTRVLQMLEEQKHIVSFGHTLAWFVVFFFISFIIFQDKAASYYIPLFKKIPYKFVHMVFSLVSYGFVLSMCSFVEYAFYDRVYSLIIPIVYFTVLKLFVQYRKFDSV